MRRTRSEIRARTGSGTRSRAEWKIRTIIRRFRVAASSGVRWLLDGFEADGEVEHEQAEVFGGIGMLARPAADHRAEAIVVKVGGESGHPVIVATRDQDLAKKVGQLAEGETVVANAEVAIHLHPSGRVEIRATGGAALTALDELVHGSGVDPWSGSTYRALGNTSSKVRAAK